MPITISFKRLSSDRVAVHLNDQQVSDFEPAALLVDQPLAPNRPTPADPRAYGQRLWVALGGKILGHAINKLPDAPDLKSLVVIRTNDPDLAAIPWEYLHDGTDFLMFKKLLVRLVPNAPIPAPPDASKPWRLVVMGSDPLLQEVRDESEKLQGYAKLPRLQVVQELDTLRNTLYQQEAPIRWHRIAPTATALIDELVPTEPVLFHYTGHGDVADGQPILCFDDGTGCMDPHPVPDLAANLRGLVYLAFLNACRTADSREPGANLALALVQHGIPVVLGTQYTVLDQAASVFAETFYRQLAHGNHPAQALYRARLQLKNKYRNEAQEWAVPVLYLAEGYDWQAQKPEPGISPASIEAPVPQTEELRSPADIIGRDTELMDLARAFLFDDHQIITIRGTGGIGKTALVHALAQRLRYHFRDGIYALSLQLPSDQRLYAADIRRRLANLLNVQHPAFDDPTAVNEQELALVAAVRGQSRILLIWDNYETVLWRLGQKEEAPTHPPKEDPAETYDPMDRSIIETKQRYLDLRRKQQAHFGPNTDPTIIMEIEDLERELQQSPHSVTTQRDEAIAVQRLVRLLTEAGIYLLFTSRQSPVGLAGETFYPTAEQGHQLGGLQPTDSAALIRTNAGKRVPSAAFVTQLAAALEHHPLALQLASKRWATSQDDEQTFLGNLQTELRKAHDPSAPMYQQSSVEINVRLSVDALPTELRERLLALTVLANPIITSLPSAVIWGLHEETDDVVSYQIDQAHTALEQLHDASLLQGQGWDNERNRAQVYTIHPVVAGVLTHLAHEQDHSVAKERYAGWINMVISRAHGEGGITYSTEVAQSTQFYLSDIQAALPHLTPEQQGWAGWRASIIFAHFGQPENAQQSITIAQTVAIETDDTRLLGRCYHQEAELHKICGNFDQAIPLYQQALQINQDLGDRQGKSVTLQQMADIHTTRGDLDHAMALLHQALDINQDLGDRQGKSVTLHNMANIHITRGDLDHAMHLYQQVLDINHALGHQHGIATTLQQMADIHTTRGDLDHAMHLLQQALDINQDLGDYRNTTPILHQMADIHITRGDLDHAMDLLHQALDINQDLGDRLNTAITLHHMARIHHTCGDLDHAMHLYQQVLDINQDLGELRLTAGVLHHMAGILTTRGDLDHAMHLLQQALDINQDLDDLQGKAITLHNMADIHITRGDLDHAMHLYQQVLDINQDLNHQHGVAATLHQMAAIHTTRGDLDHAMHLYQQSLAIKQDLGNLQGKAATLHQMARIHHTRGDLDHAMDLYQQALQINQDLGNRQGTAATLQNMANIHIIHGDLDHAMHLLHQSLHINQDLGDQYGIAACLRDMAIMQFRQGDHETAMSNAQESLRLLQSMGADPDVAIVANIIQKMEAALASSPQHPETLTPGRLVGALVDITVQALRGQAPQEELQGNLHQLTTDKTLEPVIQALLAALERTPTAAADLLTTITPLLQQETLAEQASALANIGHLAKELADSNTELYVRAIAVATQRQVGEDKEALVQLSIMLYNLAMVYDRQGQHAEAIPLLEEVMTLDERTNHPDLESDQATLEQVRRRAAGASAPGLREIVVAWVEAGRDEDQFAKIINLVCNLYIQVMRDDSQDQREKLADELGHVRAARPLPIAGANDFLTVLQHTLRGEAELLEQATQLRATLPAPLAEVLVQMEREVRERQNG